MHSIYFEHFVDVSYDLTCLSALDLLFGACWTALHVVGVSLFCEAGERCQWTGFGYVHGSYGGRGLHAWLRPGMHLNLYFIFWTALHVVGVSLFCEAGERCVSGLAFGTRQLWWPWVACLAAAWEAFECVHYIFELLCLQCMDIGIDGQWYGVRHFGFRGPVSLGAWSTWRGPWAAGRPEWRVNACCVDVYIRELDARGA